MKHFLLLPPFAVAALLTTSLWLHADASGNPCTREGPAADPPGFFSCAACHIDFQIGEGDGDFVLSGIPSTWQAGASYNLRAILSDPGQIQWGFRVTAIDANGDNAGTLTPADAWSESCVLNGRNYLRHNVAGTRIGTPDGPVTWEMTWTAPAAGTGTVYFYGVGLSCNYDSAPSGDVTYTDANASAEAAAGGPEVSLILQPDNAQIVRGRDWAMRARVVNHGTNSADLLFVSRILLSSGQYFPSTGWLSSPVSFTLLPNGQSTVQLTHPVPLSAPLMTAAYEAWVATNSSVVVAGQTIPFVIVA